jgi:hypothetical protein
MKNDTKTKTPPSTKKAWIALAITIVVTLLIAIWVAFYAWGSSSYSSPDVPRPLGDKLEYIGKEDSRCIGVFCDSKPSTTYYYATDMNPEEILHYFKKTTLDYPDTMPDWQTPETILFGLRTPHTPNIIYINYHNNGKVPIKKFDLRDPNKQHVIDINAEDYEAAKASL